MSVIRDMRPEDLTAIAEMHQKQGIDYALPDLSSPLFFVKKVCEAEVEGQRRIQGALVLKACAETMLLLAPGKAQEKMAAMQELQAATLQAAWGFGLDAIHASVPPIGFDRRLMGLGWERDRPGWNLWSRSTR